MASDSLASLSSGTVQSGITDDKLDESFAANVVPRGVEPSTVNSPCYKYWGPHAKHDDNGNKTQNNRFEVQNNSCARSLEFLVHFFAVLC